MAVIKRADSMVMPTRKYVLREIGCQYRPYVIVSEFLDLKQLVEQP